MKKYPVFIFEEDCMDSVEELDSNEEMIAFVNGFSAGINMGGYVADCLVIEELLLDGNYDREFKFLKKYFSYLKEKAQESENSKKRYLREVKLLKDASALNLESKNSYNVDLYHERMKSLSTIFEEANV